MKIKELNEILHNLDSSKYDYEVVIELESGELIYLENYKIVPKYPEYLIFTVQDF